MTFAAQPDRRVLDAILRTDLYSFIGASFPIVSPGTQFLPNWHIEAIAEALARVMRGEMKRLVINVPPRSLKSICSSVALPAFMLGHDPTRRIICVSYSDALARKHANDCRNLIKHPLYRRLFPRTEIDPRKDTEAEIATTAKGFRLAASVEGTLTGRGGSIIIIDDPIKPQDAYSAPARERVEDWYRHTLLSRLDNKTTDAIVVIMQRVHMDGLVGHLLEEDGWFVLELPAIAETKQIIPLGMGRVHTRLPGDVLHPAREPLTVLNEMKLAMGTAHFSAQYQQRPIPLSGNMIKWEWFPSYDHLPPFDRVDRVIVSWDTAMSSREFADYSACIVLYVFGQAIYVVDVIRERLDYPDLKRKVIEVHQHYRNDPSYSLLVENRGSGMSLVQELKAAKIYPIAIDPEGDKEMRMYAQTARLESGAGYLPKQAPWLDDFRAELMAFPDGRYDDQVDAFSQALMFEAKRRRPDIIVSPLTGLH